MNHFFKILPFIFCLSATVATAQMSQNLLLQNGFPMPKGEVYLQNGLLVFNHLNVGVTNYFSMGAGFLPSFLFEDGNFTYTFSLKYAFSIPERKISAGLCLFHGGSFYNHYYFNERVWENGFFIPHAVLTLGSF